jgi:hypothetical protein
MYRIFFLLCILSGGAGICQNLVVRADNNGINFLSYKNTVLLDKSRFIGVPFTTEGFYVTHKNGKKEGFWSYQGAFEPLTDKSGWKYTFNFGNLIYKYKQVFDTLFLDVSITNTSKSDTLLGVNLIPLQFEFPKRPLGFDPQLPYFHYNLDGPSIIPADYSSGKVVLTNEDINNNFFTGWVYDVNAKKMLYKIWVSSVPFNGMQTQGLPNLEKRLAPGQSTNYKIALRFYPSGTSNKAIAPSIIAQYKTKNNKYLNWKDRRPIGSLFLASDAKHDIKNNPRGYLPGGDEGKKISIHTQEGLQQLKKQIMEYAQKSITILKGMNAQGMITWDIEGQQFGHPISYVGSPDKLKQAAPEMEAIADEYFSLFKKAGLRTGICIRPQEFIISNNGESAIQKDIKAKDIAALLIKKIKYARTRWGCTLFYIDSNFGTDGGLLSPDIFRIVFEAVPDVLLIPEHQNQKYFQYTAPFDEMRFGGRAVDDLTHTAYPSSFFVLTVGEAFFDAKGKRVISDEELKEIIKQGNVLLFRAWYPDEPTNSIIKKLYSEVNPGK